MRIGDVYSVPPVQRPPDRSTYAPTYSQDYVSKYAPAAIITLSEAAQAYLRYLRESEPQS